MMKAKFMGMKPHAFVKEHLSPDAFPLLSREIRAILAMFGSTYRCEQLFSRMKITKSHLRSQLTDRHLNDLLLLHSSSVQPSIEEILKDQKQMHSSH